MKPHKLLSKYLLRFSLPERANACLGLYLKAGKLRDFLHKTLELWISWCWILAAIEGGVFGFSIHHLINEDKLMALLLNVLAVFFVYVSVSHLLLSAVKMMDRVVQYLFSCWQLVKEMLSLESQRKTAIKNHD